MGPENKIKAELEEMYASALEPTDPFMGMAFFQFQTAYFKGGSEMNFGLFRLGSREINKTGDICDKGMSCRKYPVHCLTTAPGLLPPIVAGRADAVANVWGGKVNQSLMC